jgi:hypothetical protein
LSGSKHQQPPPKKNNAQYDGHSERSEESHDSSSLIYAALGFFTSFRMTNFISTRKKNTQHMTIAVDFDGTIVEHRYPEIGREIPFAIETLKMLTREGHRLILWSVREGKLLDEAVEWCRERGLEFYAVNKDYPEEKTNDTNYSRKLKVGMFIDDRNVGGLPDWGIIYKMVTQKKSYRDILIEELNSEAPETKKRRWPFGR